MKISTMAHRPWFHVAVAIVFVLGMAAGRGHSALTVTKKRPAIVVAGEEALA